MNIAFFNSLFGYKAWSDDRISSAALKLQAYKVDAALAFVRQQLNHVVRVEELFRARLRGDQDPHISTNTDEVPELDELLERLAASNRWYASYVESLPADRLNENVRFRFTDGKGGSLNRAEILYHVVNHATYHRGAIGRVLDESSVARPPDTYTVFVHAVQPERRHEPLQRDI